MGSGRTYKFNAKNIWLFPAICVHLLPFTDSLSTVDSEKFSSRKHISIMTILEHTMKSGKSLINKTVHDLQKLNFPVSVSTGIENYSRWKLYFSALEIG